MRKFKKVQIFKLTFMNFTKMTYYTSQMKVSKMSVYHILSLFLNQIQFLWRSIFYEYRRLKCRHRQRTCRKWPSIFFTNANAWFQIYIAFLVYQEGKWSSANLNRRPVFGDVSQLWAEYPPTVLNVSSSYSNSCT